MKTENENKGVLIRINLNDSINMKIIKYQLAQKKATGKTPTKKQVVEAIVKSGVTAFVATKPV